MKDAYGPVARLSGHKDPGFPRSTPSWPHGQNQSLGKLRWIQKHPGGAGSVGFFGQKSGALAAMVFGSLIIWV